MPLAGAGYTCVGSTYTAPNSRSERLSSRQTHVFGSRELCSIDW